MEESDVIVSIVPPDTAREVARGGVGYEGIFVDANAVSLRAALTIGDLVEAGGAQFVDGAIIGDPPPPRSPTRTLSRASPRIPNRSPDTSTTGPAATSSGTPHVESFH